MKTIKKIGLLCVFLTILSSCVTTQSAYLQSSKDKKEVEVFMTKLPERPYEEIAFIAASGSVFHGSKSLLKNLKRRAEKENADAIINVKFTYIPWVLISIPTVEGVAIKYKN
jgi:hypothetical protein